MVTLWKCVLKSDCSPHEEEFLPHFLSVQSNICNQILFTWTENKNSWSILDVAFLPATFMMLISVAALVSLKSIRNIIAPPVVIVTDCKEVSFDFPTRFKSHLVSNILIFPS